MYIPIIGLEIHVQLKTASKMFCSCSADYREDPPNTHCCPVCLGLPGALPVPNKKAIEQTIKMGLALSCEINNHSYFARKNYFYPDLSKGYQITQYEKPFCHNGILEISTENEEKKRIRITRIHLEEDTGKSVHVDDDDGESYTLLDFNKSGIPLMELVTQPDFRSATDVWYFAKKIRQIVRYLDISDGDMEKGQLRIEPNISLLKIGDEETLGMDVVLPPYKVEIKNLNSFSVLKKGILYETDRQRKILENGETPKQETRGWDDVKGQTFSQRTKEEAHDYRYFPEPDIPPIEISEGTTSSVSVISLEKIREGITELPDCKRDRFINEYGLSFHEASVLTEEVETAKWFEKAVSLSRDDAKEISHWVVTEVLGLLKETEKELVDIKLKPGQLTEIVSLVKDGKISRSTGKQLLLMLWDNTGDVRKIIAEKKMEQVSDTNNLQQIIEKILTENPKPVADYKSGKKQSLQFLVGMVMKETRGKANIQTVLPLLEASLKKL